MASIDDLIVQTWDLYNNASKIPSIVAPAIPILWFGDYDAYLQSPNKIITVSANPSWRELMNEKEEIRVGIRFPSAVNLVGKQFLLSSDISDY